MSDSPQVSRRQILKYLSAVPMLPLGSMASASLLVGCGGSSGSSPVTAPEASFVSAEFTPMAAPTLADAPAMATTTVGSTLNLTLSDNSVKSYRLAYEPFFITGEDVPDGNGGTILAGGYYDINNQPIIDNSVPGSERHFFSDSPDGTSLLALPNPTVPGIKGKAVFAVVQFEYTTRTLAGDHATTSAEKAATSAYGTLPSPIAILTLDQDQETGKLTLVKYHNVDMSSANGLWITCGASLSPWNTHLSSEEYEPDATTAATTDMFKAYSRHLYGNETTAKPYHYGHLPEITVNPDGTGSVKKHYCMGRISHELIQVMPDERTVIMGDDYTNGGFFMFVADQPRDLSAGTLYVAKYEAGYSIDPAGTPTKMSWIRLGHATSDEVEGWADTLNAADIMEWSTTVPADPTGYTEMFVDGKLNWIRIKPGMERQAAFLETHRYANIKSASMAFTKMEGTTVNIKDKVAYSALQNIQASMVQGNGAWLARNDVAIPAALLAGGVMAHDLGGDQFEIEDGITKTVGSRIDSEWVPTQTRALLMGEDIAADALGNTANPDKIANPDNLKFSEKMRTLFIGEDSGQHVNNFLWAYNIDTKKLSRLMSIPAGGESTGLHEVDEINGWTYIMSNFQHAGDWSALHAVVESTLDPLVRANYKDRYGAAVGYLTGDPVAVTLK